MDVSHDEVDCYLVVRNDALPQLLNQNHQWPSSAWLQEVSAQPFENDGEEFDGLKTTTPYMTQKLHVRMCLRCSFMSFVAAACDVCSNDATRRNSHMRDSRVWVLEADDSTISRVFALCGRHFREGLDGDEINRDSTDDLYAVLHGLEQWDARHPTYPIIVFYRAKMQIPFIDFHIKPPVDGIDFLVGMSTSDGDWIGYALRL